MKAICFDIEAADNEEILELSVFDYESDKEIFHNFFKPRNISYWPDSEAVHHITPEMVADKPYFSRFKKEVQQIIDSADLLVGFAVDNDIKYLLNAGISIPDSKAIVEVKHWYWICRGKEDGVLLDAVPKLTVCANNIGIEFPEETAHSASTDTSNTLKLFKALVEDFCQKEKLEPGLSEKSLELLNKRYADERLNFNRLNASGYLTLNKRDDGFYLKNSQKEQGIGISIKVESRYIAEHDIRRMFTSREDKTKRGLFHLKDKDIKKFLSYSNSFDPEKEMFYRKIYNPRKNSKNKLNFRLS